VEEYYVNPWETEEHINRERNELLKWHEIGFDDKDEILDAVAWKMYKNYQSPFNYNDLTGLDLNYEDFQEAVYFGHEKYGNPNLELLDENSRAYFTSGGITSIEDFGDMAIPDYDYIDFDPTKSLFVLETDKPHNISISKGDEIYDDWLAEMGHAVQFHGLDAETQDSIMTELWHQKDLYGDSLSPRHYVSEPVNQPIINALSNLPLVGNIFDSLKRYKDVGYSMYGVESQIEGDHREGHPTIEYEAHQTLEPEFEKELYEYLIKLANERN
tara:strand:+ start:3955 stop:4767 length:813 start_codon:yes stop_codon:yes gene_type:complete